MKIYDVGENNVSSKEKGEKSVKIKNRLEL